MLQLVAGAFSSMGNLTVLDFALLTGFLAAATACLNGGFNLRLDLAIVVYRFDVLFAPVPGPLC